MRTHLTHLLLFPVFTLFISINLYAQAGNNTCATATVLTPGSTCSPTTVSLQKATSALTDGSAAGGGFCGGATAATTFDVWFKFTATTPFPAITVGNLGANLTTSTTYVELLSGTACAAFTSLNCQNVVTRLVPTTALVTGTTYYIRVYTTVQGTSNPASKYNFDICIQTAPANDECTGAVSLLSNSSCSTTSTSLDLATASTGIPAGCASGGTHYDVWYQFVATAAIQTITISSLSATIGNPEMQLYSGSCGSLVSLACGTTSVTSAGLAIGSTYYIRVSNVGTDPSSIGGAGFSICVTAPVPASIDYGKSYINVTKGSTGGTVNPGDTLEMRFTLVVSAKTVDSLSILDTLYNTRGFRLVPGSIALRTNEGKLYKSFTDAFDSDAGWYTTSGSDTVVHINFGTGASNTARGQLSNTSRPSVFNATCIVMATYRVVVYAPYNTLINFRTGVLTTHDPATTLPSTVSFAPDNLIVYQSPGLCPNAVSATNALGAEFNGTFGTPSGIPLARNRGTTPYTTYKYGMFTAAANSPQDYYYGITNNTSGKFTTVNTWAKPDANSYRIFNLWDITGDHTGTNNAQGNPACDTTQPISPTNPCGYMLVINSAYRTDTAFTYTVNNLCPNTYYELSAWFKNMCYKCGCDSTGAGTASATYIPSGPGDSSGVQPNIAFDVNGIDYYTTGNIAYKGTTPTGSDASNQWLKRGFVYLTGPSENAFTLTLRNNAPGGGGNDWALDDIAVTTCLPNMQYSPSLNPTTCNNNAMAINDTIRSYFSNYKYYKWQRSIDAGTSWSDIASANGTGTPAWNGSAWEYITSYTIPPSATYVSNNGDRYRVVLATTSGNLSNGNCQFTDGVSLINLNVLDCNNPPPLNTSILSFNAVQRNSHAVLYWTTNRETGSIRYRIEKSADGLQFATIGSVAGANMPNEVNRYSFIDSVATNRTYYRVSLETADGKRTYSRIVQLQTGTDEFSVYNLSSFFESAVSFDVRVNSNSRIDVALLSSSGNVITQQTFSASSGANNFVLPALGSLSPGIYILQVRNGQKRITLKAIKK